MKLFVMIAAVFLPSQAHAYFDPGTGSMLVQILVGAVAAVAVFWKRIKTAIMAWFQKKKNDELR